MGCAAALSPLAVAAIDDATSSALPGLQGPFDVQSTLEVSEIGLMEASSVSYDAASNRLIVISSREMGVVPAAQAVDLAGSGDSVQNAAPGGVAPESIASASATAVAPDGTFFGITDQGSRLVQVSADGAVLASHDISDANLDDAQSMAVAPSSDPTDDGDELSLYVAEVGSVTELGTYSDFTTLAGGSATYERTIEAFNWNPPVVDASGIAFKSGVGLIVLDGEVDETTSGGVTHYEGVNVWEASTAGAVQRTWTTVGSFSNEPVGAAVNPSTGHLYVSQDSGGGRIFEIDPGPDGDFGTSDDDIVRDFATPTGDPEGLAYGGGWLWIAAGAANDVQQVSATSGALQNSFDVEGLGARDPEGIEYDTSTGRLWVIGSSNSTLVEVTTSGALCANHNLGNLIPTQSSELKLAGLAKVNSSLYVSDRGADFNPNATDPDGRIFEFTVEAGTSCDDTATPPPSPTPSPTPTATPTPAPTGTPAPTATPTPTPTPTTESTGHPFTDIDGTQFENDIIWLYDEGITGGCTSTLFCPDSSVLRDQMASFLDRALSPPSTSTDFFDDDDGNIHEGAINRLAAAGITGGCGTREYCPKDPVKRDQMASFLVRAFDLPFSSFDRFFDDEGNLHENQINTLAASGITGGCAPSQYCPNNLVTRGQMAAFLHRAIE
ncbi:MAG: S-layer homology domain-containing protein [Chloroflexota bacterium]